jgi:Fe-S cluster biogenesis protein NfuA
LSAAPDAADAALKTRAEQLVERVLRPIIAADGGAIELVSATRQRLVIRLSGACAGCPGRPYTLRGVIEPAARQALGTDVHVELAIDSAP